MGAAGKRIGFVDYRLENFHSNVYLKALAGPLKDRGFTVAGGMEMLAGESRAWAEENGVPYFTDAEALNEAVDYYMVLAPANPEVHLELCEKVFPFGKATYVDKTFAPDLETAERIFALADEHGVPMQTTSALRYTNVQDYVREVGAEKVKHMVTWGGGRLFDEYAIHPVEMAVSCMGAGVERLMRRGTENHSQLLLDLSGGRTAVVNVYTSAKTPYAASVTTDEGTRHLLVEGAEMFPNSAAAIFDLFETGQPNIDRQESLMIRRILDAAGEEAALEGFVNL